MFSEYFAIKNNYVAICSRLGHFCPYIDWTNHAQPCSAAILKRTLCLLYLSNKTQQTHAVESMLV